MQPTNSAVDSPTATVTYNIPVPVLVGPLVLSTAALSTGPQSLEVLLLHGTFLKGGVGCFAILLVSPNNQSLVTYASSFSLNVTSATTAVIELPETQVFGTMNTSSFTVTLAVARSCLRGPHDSAAMKVYFETPSPPAVPLTLAQRSISTTAVVVGSFSGNPAVAVQADRSTLAFSVQYCRPQDGQLDFIDSPIPLALGATEIAFYAGGMIMNLAMVIGFACLQLAASIAIRRSSESMSHALARLRCPSLANVPLMVLLQPLTMCAMVTALRGGSALQYVAACVVCICGLLPIGYGVFTRANFSAVATVVPMGRTHHSFLSSLQRFFTGSTKWCDDPPNSGFVHRHGLFFSEYCDGRHWFCVVEMAMCVACGVVEGMKFGEGRCNAVLVVLAVVFLGYLVLVIVFRPFHVPYLNVHTIVVSILMAVSSTCVVLDNLFHVEVASDVAQRSTSAILYLLMIRAAYDVFSVARRVYSQCRSNKKKLETAKEGHEVILVDLFSCEKERYMEQHDFAVMDETVSAWLTVNRSLLSDSDAQSIHDLQVALFLPNLQLAAFAELAARMRATQTLEKSALPAILLKYNEVVAEDEMLRVKTVSPIPEDLI